MQKQLDKAQRCHIASSKRSREAEVRCKKAETLSRNRLAKNHIVNDAFGVLKDTNEMLKEQYIKTVEISKERQEKGQPRVALMWPLWMVQLILEQLVDGTPPSAIAPNIASQAELILPGKICILVRDLPKVRFIRSCQTTLRIVG